MAGLRPLSGLPPAQLVNVPPDMGLFGGAALHASRGTAGGHGAFELVDGEPEGRRRPMPIQPLGIERLRCRLGSLFGRLPFGETSRTFLLTLGSQDGRATEVDSGCCHAGAYLRATAAPCRGGNSRSLFLWRIREPGRGAQPPEYLFILENTRVRGRGRAAFGVSNNWRIVFSSTPCSAANFSAVFKCSF